MHPSLKPKHKAINWSLCFWALFLTSGQCIDIELSRPKYEIFPVFRNSLFVLCYPESTFHSCQQNLREFLLTNWSMTSFLILPDLSTEIPSHLIKKKKAKESPLFLHAGSSSYTVSCIFVCKVREILGYTGMANFCTITG